MEEKSTVQTDAREVWASDRRKVAMAAKLMTCCLGIPVEPGFDLTGPANGDFQGQKPRDLGECVFKDAWYVGPADECQQLQLLLVDEKGNILVRSRGAYYLGHAMDLVDRLPLRLSPHADDWLKDALGEPGPKRAGLACPSPRGGDPLAVHALGIRGSELKGR